MRKTRGEIIREKRKEHGLSQHALSEMLIEAGFQSSARSISEVENNTLEGDRWLNNNFERALKICEILDIERSDIIESDPVVSRDGIHCPDLEIVREIFKDNRLHVSWSTFRGSSSTYAFSGSRTNKVLYLERGEILGGLEYRRFRVAELLDAMPEPKLENEFELPDLPRCIDELGFDYELASTVWNLLLSRFFQDVYNHNLGSTGDKKTEDENTWKQEVLLQFNDVKEKFREAHGEKSVILYTYAYAISGEDLDQLIRAVQECEEIGTDYIGIIPNEHVYVEEAMDAKITLPTRKTVGERAKELSILKNAGYEFLLGPVTLEAIDGKQDGRIVTREQGHLASVHVGNSLVSTMKAYRYQGAPEGWLREERAAEKLDPREVSADTAASPEEGFYCMNGDLYLRQLPGFGDKEVILARYHDTDTLKYVVGAFRDGDHIRFAYCTRSQSISERYKNRPVFRYGVADYLPVFENRGGRLSVKNSKELGRYEKEMEWMMEELDAPLGRRDQEWSKWTGSFWDILKEYREIQEVELKSEESQFRNSLTGWWLKKYWK